MKKRSHRKSWPGRSIGLTFLLTMALLMVVGIIEMAAAVAFFFCLYQGDTSHRTEGNGLGLTIVRRIVTLHGGEVGVESAPEKGSVFTVRLPQKRGSGTAAALPTRH